MRPPAMPRPSIAAKPWSEDTPESATHLAQEDSNRNTIAVPPFFPLAKREDDMALHRSGWQRGFAVAIVATGSLALREPAAAEPCANLLTLALPQAKVVAATPVPGPSFTAPDGQ